MSGWVGLRERQAPERLDEPQDLGPPDVVGIQRPVEPEPAPARGHGERADRREPIPAIPLAEAGRLAARGPGAAADGLEHEAALVEKHEATAGAPGVFLWLYRLSYG